MKEEKKELKKTKEEKEPVKEFETNFAYLFSKVKENFRTEENKNYLKENFKNKIDYFNNMSKEDLNKDLGQIVDILNSTLLDFEARKNFKENKESDIIEKKENDYGEVY